MFLIAILIAIAGLQIWGYRNPLHHDSWFDRWYRIIAGLGGLKDGDVGRFLILVFVPATLVGLIAYNLRAYYLFWVIFSSVILLYCLGRGRFVEIYLNYLEATRTRNWDRAARYSESLGSDLDELQLNDWNDLNGRTLSHAAYRSFERLFAVIFWFVLFGPAGALLYRLTHIIVVKAGQDTAKYWLWVMEWPAVRVLSFSFAMTGNFVGCIERARTLITCVNSSSGFVLKTDSIRGSVD